ncbi:aldo/keto reductase family protein [Ceratobasidium sp. AG-Ba]|nr:aldo/keto reductase family protein [Ceratobasidium sp. AG-Ba]
MTVPLLKLNTGTEVPAIGLGCWLGHPGGGEETYEMVKTALKLGYRHFDTASAYENEEGGEPSASRVYLAPKYSFLLSLRRDSDHDDPLRGFESSLKALDVGYIDMFLMHWPIAHIGSFTGPALQPDESPTFVETWLGMEKLLETGKLKHIGVSNFSVKNLEILLEKATVVPSANQVELHPCYPQNKLLEYCRSKGIQVTAYCPLGQYKSPFFSDPELNQAATQMSTSLSRPVAVSQIVLGWAVQRGTIVIPKSSNEGRLKQNLEFISLPDDVFKIVDEFHKKPGMHKALDRYTLAKPGTVVDGLLTVHVCNIHYQFGSEDVQVLDMTVPLIKLNTGAKVPAVGLGCWMGRPGGDEEAYEMVKLGLKLGYRHFDTASRYKNEEAVGKAIRDSGIPRSEVFVTTKLVDWDHDDPLRGFEGSLKALDIDYIDLYLMHWPMARLGGRDGKICQPEESPTFVETWLAMEKLLGTGKVKQIGVSNFSIKTLNTLLEKATVVPAVNQVELHPCYPQNELLGYCKSKGIHLIAYCPLGQYRSPFFSDTVFIEAASRLSNSLSKPITPSQLVLSWAVQRGTIVIPKSSKEERLKQNIDIITLPDDVFKIVDEYHKRPGMHKTLDEYALRDPGTVGWTYEQMGWNLDKEGNVVE